MTNQLISSNHCPTGDVSKEGVTKRTATSYFEKVSNGAPEGRFGKLLLTRDAFYSDKSPNSNKYACVNKDFEIVALDGKNFKQMTLTML